MPFLVTFSVPKMAVQWSRDAFSCVSDPHTWCFSRVGEDRLKEFRLFNRKKLIIHVDTRKVPFYVVLSCPHIFLNSAGSRDCGNLPSALLAV